MKDGSKIAGSIAIGKNTVARTGSVMLGDHSYTGKLGDIEINPANAMTYNNGIYSTTLGAGAYNSGSLAAVTGALSIASGKDDKDTRNTGATIYGSMNSIESATSDSSYSGVASSVLGFANRTQNANAALIWGTGNEGNNVKIDLASELHNITGVVNGKSRVTLGTGFAGITNGQASVIMLNGSTTINGVVGIDKTGKISGVANGEISATSKDAVNGSQLHQTNQNVAQNKADIAQNRADIYKNRADIDKNKADIKNLDNRVTNVEEVAKKHTTVTEGDNIVVSENTNADGGKEYKVALNKDITLAGDTGDFVSISGSKGTIWASGSVAAGNVVMDGATATVSGLGNTTTAYDGFANGKGKAATEEQLKEVATEAGKHTQVKAGTNVGVVPSETDGTNVYTVNADGTTVSGDSNVVVTAGAKDANNVTNYGVKLNKDLKGIESVSNGAAKLTLSSHPLFGATAELTNGKASVELKDSTTIINGKVQVRQDGSIGGVTAGRVDNDAVNLGQLKDVKAEALKHTTLSDGKNTTVEATVKDGQTDYKVNVAGDLTDITSVINGGAKLALNGEAGVAGLINGKGASVYLQDGYTKINNKVSIDQDGKISGVAAGTADTDAVNVSQLKKVSDTANAGWTLSTNGNATAGTKVTPGALVDFSGDNNVSVSNKGTAVSVKLNNALQDIESISNGDAKLALNGAAGTAGIINGQGASVYMQGSTTVINNKVSVDKDGKISGVAAGKISADSTDAVNGSQLNAVATEAGKHSKVVNGTNTNVEESTVDGQKVYKVNLNDNIMVGDVTGKYVSISGTNGTIEATGAIATKDRVYADKGGKLADIDVTGNTISNGASSIVLDGSNVKVNDKVTIDQNGKVTGVADGDVKENSKDAVNGSQLYKTNQEVFNNTNRINQLGSRVNKVGAGAAALAALHPMDFDPDDKLTFSAGYGNYGGENAAAIGAYYRPDEKVMFSIGGTVGNGENMVNAGVSFSLDRTNHVSNSRTAMAREILDLRAEVTELKAMVAKGGLGSIAEDKMKIFPDVAENHWAYEYVGKLAAAGIIEGYPDGKFSGDRMMSRYEFAAMLYRAMQKGAQLDSKIINEFAPEMGRIRVDRISGEDGDRDKIERVRVNAVKGERDHYGNKLAK